MAAWFKSSKENDEPNLDNENTTNGAQEESSESSEKVTVTEAAHSKITELIENAASPVLGVRILADAPSPMNPQFSLAFVQDGEDIEGDTVLEQGGYNIYIDEDSLPFMEDVQLDFTGAGFRIDKKLGKSTASGPLADRVQTVIEEQINPALALHGGSVRLLDIKDSTAYIELGGGCRGCGMVDVTLKQGIEVMIKQHVPEITDILDSTDHASGSNPYYQPSK